jgi:cysteinyl-tRNA synthetase
MELVLQRQAAKEDKNFQLADELRKKVDELWYIIIDTRDGATVERKQ